MVPVCKVKIRPHRKTLVAVKAGRFARLEELGRDADAPFRCGSNLFELTWQARERERGGESGSKKEMSHARWTLAGNCVLNNGQSLAALLVFAGELGWESRSDDRLIQRSGRKYSSVLETTM